MYEPCTDYLTGVYKLDQRFVIIGLMIGARGAIT